MDVIPPRMEMLPSRQDAIPRQMDVLLSRADVLPSRTDVILRRSGVAPPQNDAAPWQVEELAQSLLLLHAIMKRKYYMPSTG